MFHANVEATVNDRIRGIYRQYGNHWSNDMYIKIMMKQIYIEFNPFKLWTKEDIKFTTNRYYFPVLDW